MTKRIKKTHEQKVRYLKDQIWLCEEMLAGMALGLPLGSDVDPDLEGVNYIENVDLFAHWNDRLNKFRDELSELEKIERLEKKALLPY
jgi:hypothetical protein